MDARVLAFVFTVFHLGYDVGVRGNSLMITDGITKDRDLFRKSVDAYDPSDPLDHSIDNIQAQQLLDNDLALLAVLKSISNTRGIRSLSSDELALFIKLLTTPGLLMQGEWKEDPGPGEVHASGNKITLGPNQALVNGRVILMPEITLDMPAAPSTGTRDDLIFLEVWKQKIDPVTGEGLSASAGSVDDPVAYPQGWVNGDPIVFGNIFTDVDPKLLEVAEAGDIERIQWQWQIRVVSGVDFSAHPKGLGAPNVFAKSTNILYELSDDGVTFEATGGSLGLNARSYALPLFKVHRQVGVPGIGEAALSDLRPPLKLFGGIQGEIFELQEQINELVLDLLAHTGATGNAHSTKHSDLLGVEEVNPSSDDTTKNKHLSNADAKRWESHLNAKGNTHDTKHSQLGEIEGIDPTSDDLSRTKHVSNADAKRWEGHLSANAPHPGHETPEGAQQKVNEHANDMNNPHNVTVEQIGAAPADHVHNAGDIKTGIMHVDRLPKATTSAQGIVRLNNEINSPQTDQAATADAVRRAYNLANAALPKSGGVVTGLLDLNSGGTGRLRIPVGQNKY